MGDSSFPGCRPVLGAGRFRWPGTVSWLVLVGVVLRLAHYLWNHTIWYDEALLLINVLGKDALSLLGPLDHEQAAPPLFLWGLRGIAVWGGDHPYLWRLPPFLLSCLTLWVLALLARRLLPPGPAVVVTSLAAFSDAFVWLGCNVKPYILDACLAGCFLYAYVRTAGWPLARRLLVYACAAPVILCLSYPMVFLYAGLLLAALPALYRPERPGVRVAYGVLLAAVLLTFAALYFGPMRAQRVDGLMSFWEGKFPPVERPAAVPGWVVGNALLVFYYCYNPVGVVLALFALGGAWRCLREGRSDWVCLCLGPLGGCLGAAFLKAYPFSGNRLMMFAAPGILLMAGEGLSAALGQRGRFPGAFSREWGRGWLAACLCAALILPEVGLCAWRIYRPWSKPDAAGITRFIKARCLADDLVASEQVKYRYFFFRELRSLTEVREGFLSGGQRVWVAMEHGDPERRGRHVLTLLGSGWELRLEKRFHRGSVFLLVRPGKPPSPAH
jgi:hypothetical protein